MTTAQEILSIARIFTAQGTQLGLELRGAGYVEILDLSRKYKVSA